MSRGLLTCCNLGEVSRLGRESMANKPMTAWLIMWEGIGNHAAVKQPYVDIVSARKTPKYIEDYLRRLYGVSEYSLAERVDHERYWKPNKALVSVTNEWAKSGPLIAVGHNPHLKAQKVRNSRGQKKCRNRPRDCDLGAVPVES